MSFERSTLLTSPLSFADFALRAVFFALAPFAIVLAAELFPVRGALIDVGLALVVFMAGEAPARTVARVPILRAVLSQAFGFQSFYRSRTPRPFAYYVFYPLLFPYWLSNRDARSEFLVFRSYTIGGLVILLATLAWQYFSSFRPELGPREFLPSVLVCLGAETLLVLALLMPIATTLVWYHTSLRRGRLVALLLIAFASTGLSLYRVSRARDPIVSYTTRERVILRTSVAPGRAHWAMLEAARAGIRARVLEEREVFGDGEVEGPPVDAARAALRSFYKTDEALAFHLWASPRSDPSVVVLYFESRQKKRPIWLAIKRDGSEIVKRRELPKGAFAAMRKAADGSDPESWVWPEDGASPGAKGARHAK